MKSDNIFTINSIQEYLDKINNIKVEKRLEKVWFRGVPDKDYGLEPSLFRRATDPKIERQLLNRFKARALPFIDNLPNNENYWEWLFIMQHYGIPTRLLDWSESALISLAFAVIYREEKHKDKTAGVWMLDPIILNRDFVRGFKEEEILPNITDLTVARAQIYKDPEVPLDFPVAIYGPMNSNRIAAQKGVFTLFPFKDKFKLEDLAQAENFLFKLEIPEDKIAEIKEQLIILGITENNIYPGLDSIAKEINREILSI